MNKAVSSRKGDKKGGDLNEKIGSNKAQKETGEEAKEEVKEDKSNFRYFWKFIADEETFLIPYDHEHFESTLIDKQLLLDLINGRQNKVLDFDFSAKEE
jgi:hypothetical protein